jgi:hypothetical protein
MSMNFKRGFVNISKQMEEVDYSVQSVQVTLTPLIPIRRNNSAAKAEYVILFSYHQNRNL